MIRVPSIGGPRKGQEFHDSSLIEFAVSPQLDAIRIVVSTPDDNQIERLWKIDCSGVLRLEYETLGSGDEGSRTPLEVYEIYNDLESAERKRWVERLKLLAVPPAKASSVYHLVLASSFVRGWDTREHLEGINIVCRSVTISAAPSRYSEQAYSRPRIDADNSDPAK